MINLLFISSSPRAELLRGHFQQRLRIRFDVVADFDHGLKDVFEKRPATVFIQDQIAGVTGESVARHIQMLLGSSAPTFILLHEANPKARPVPGLFTQLLDLSGHFDLVCASFEHILHAMLGTQWEQVLVEQPQPASEPLPLAAADMLVETLAVREAGTPQIRDTELAEKPAPTVPSFDDLLQHDTPGGPPAEPQAAATVSAEEPPAVEPPACVRAAALVAVPAVPAVVADQPVPPQPQPTLTVKAASVPPAVAEPETEPAEQPYPVDEHMLAAFEENYSGRSSNLMRWFLLLPIGVAALCVLLYLLMSWSSVTRRLERPASAPSKPVAGMLVHPPVSSVRPLSVAQPAAPVTVHKLPAFIPAAGFDPEFGAKAPGWSRYTGPGREYRLFQEAGALRAVQVLALGKQPLTNADMQLVLKELTGAVQYSVDSSKQVDGLVVEKAFLGRNELLVYRIPGTGAIKAFVIALQ